MHSTDFQSSCVIPCIPGTLGGLQCSCWSYSLQYDWSTASLSNLSIEILNTHAYKNTSYHCWLLCRRKGSCAHGLVNLKALFCSSWTGQSWCVQSTTAPVATEYYNFSLTCDHLLHVLVHAQEFLSHWKCSIGASDSCGSVCVCSWEALSRVHCGYRNLWDLP